MSGSYVNAYVWPSGAVQSSRVNSGRYSFSRAQNLNVLLEVTRLPSDWTLADWISSIAAAYSSRPSSPKLCHHGRSEEHTSELQSLMRITYAVFCLQKKKTKKRTQHRERTNTQKETILV